MGTEFVLPLFFVVLSVLIGLLAWIGNRIHEKIDFLTERLEEKLDDVNRTLGSIERDLRNDLVEHDKRITILETNAGIERRQLHGRTFP